MSTERQKELNNRAINELVEFLNPKLQIRDGVEQGRISGALEWRQARGEAGSSAAGSLLILFLMSIVKLCSYKVHL